MLLGWGTAGVPACVLSFEGYCRFCSCSQFKKLVHWEQLSRKVWSIACLTVSMVLSKGWSSACLPVRVVLPRVLSLEDCSSAGVHAALRSLAFVDVHVGALRDKFVQADYLRRMPKDVAVCVRR